MENEEHGEDSTGITKPQSAYSYFLKENTSQVRQELLKEGKDASLGSVVQIVSKLWRELPEVDKAPFEAHARDDKERYLRECQLRDEEVAKQQEERRIANNSTFTESKFRGSTMANTESSQIKSEIVRKRRELTDEELQEKDERKSLKRLESEAIAAEHEKLKKSRVEQADARLKYLLNQSDIFSHFGVGGKKKDFQEKEFSSSKKEESNDFKSKRRGATAKRANFDDLDDEEREIVGAEGDEDDDNALSSKKPHNTILLRQPSIITGGTMRQYQLEGLNWMIRLLENGINGILADEMGLGKTLQSISILAYMKEFMNISGPHLVMVPKSTLSNWMNEFRNWCPSLRTLKFHADTREERELIAGQLKGSVSHDQRDWDVVVTTYEVVNLEKNALTKIAWRYLVIDEAHRLKNEASQFSQTVRLLNTQYRLLLTGTPLQNNLHELWALLNFLLPDVFGSSEQFDEWFNLDVDDTAAKESIISQLHKILRPFMLRRLKVDVEKSLPPKTETILFTGMSAVQKSLYTQVLLRDIDAINGGGANGSRTAILNIVMQLRKCCNHPYLFPGVEDRTLDPLGDHLYQNCGKMFLLDKLLKKMKERDHRVLIFSQMTRMLDILEDYLISRGYLYCRIDGNTSYDEREDRIADFNRQGSEKFVFLLSTRAGGLGINLQTADTVIIYDSDWNPQADLQAQDRAHRIGQKKPVQVFRLITEDSVEVKVVERAQQKLKLDAMVVQQGRLQDKERKLSKQDLLDTIKFGADKIFRSKESTITDDDIDLILADGKKRTEEMNEKLQLAEKGDLYNFKLDSSTSTQVFGGKDYADKAFREAELFNFIDIGKRERKVIPSYSEAAQRTAVEDIAEKRPKIPRHLKLPKMDDWQFYNKQKLQELHDEEIARFEEMIDKGEIPQSGISRFVVLDPEKHADKTRLLEEAFGKWTRVHYNNFIKASAKYGRAAYDKIAKDINMPLDEVKRYGETFWVKGPSTFPAPEWEKVVKAVEKGEKKLEEIQRLSSATKKLITMFSDPWEQLSFRHVGNQGRIFNAMEDRYLLCLTHLHGYGNWDLIRSSIRRCDRFRFDFFIQACTSEALGKRCEVLMKAAEREVNEIEKKKLTVEALASSNSRPKDLSDANKTKLESLMKEIKAESLRLAQARLQLQNLKVTHKPKTEGKSGITATAISGTTKKKGPQPKSKSAASISSSAFASAIANAPKATGSGQGKVGGPRAAPVPNSVLPELCRLLNDAGPDGISKVVDKFVANHPSIAKRQIEMKINEIAIKEKRSNDTKLTWYILPEYEKYLTMPDGVADDDGMDIDTAVELAPTTTASKGNKSSKNSLSSDPHAQNSSSKKRKSEAIIESKQYEDDMEPSSFHNTATFHNKAPEPRKYKRAFGIFVNDKRKEAKKMLPVESQSSNDELRDLLKKMWDELDDGQREEYLRLEKEDKERYDNEMAEWSAQKNSDA